MLDSLDGWTRCVFHRAFPGHRAKQAEEGHGDGQGVDDGPFGGGNCCQSLKGMEHPNDHVTDPCHHRYAPAQRIRCESIAFTVLSLTTAVWRLMFIYLSPSVVVVCLIELVRSFVAIGFLLSAYFWCG
jgi:hypothetical protein